MITPTHADWEALRRQRDTTGYELALAVRSGDTLESTKLAAKIITLSGQMTDVALAIDEADK